MKGTAVSVSKAAGERQAAVSVQRYRRLNRGPSTRSSDFLLEEVGSCLVLVSTVLAPRSSTASSSPFLQLGKTFIELLGPVLSSTFAAESVLPMIWAWIIAKAQVPILAWNRRPLLRKRGRV